MTSKTISMTFEIDKDEVRVAATTLGGKKTGIAIPMIPGRQYLEACELGAAATVRRIAEREGLI